MRNKTATSFASRVDFAVLRQSTAGDDCSIFLFSITFPVTVTITSSGRVHTARPKMGLDRVAVASTTDY
jgi:hypothetical protein